MKVHAAFLECLGALEPSGELRQIREAQHRACRGQYRRLMKIDGLVELEQLASLRRRGAQRGRRLYLGNANACIGELC